MKHQKFVAFFAISLLSGSVLPAHASGTDIDARDQILAASERSELQVLSLENKTSVRTNGDALLAQACRDWRLSIPELLRFLRKADRISSEETHHYDTFPCDYVGVFSFPGHVWKFELNAGSTMVIFVDADQGQYSYYACGSQADAQCASLFPFDLPDDTE
jgi:hypothetical protein